VVDEAAARSLDEWRRRPEVAAVLERTRTMNLLVISVDALRADQLARGAAGRADFPHLAALLDRSVWFEHGFAPGAGTDISLTTFVTGRWNPFQSIATTLPEALAARGRLTHAILPREVLRYVPEPLLTRGQASVDRVVTDSGKRDVGDRITAGETTDRALAFLDRAGGNRFALWTHYFDVHEHLQLKKPYRELLAIVDAEVGRLVTELERRGLADETIVVLFSDHGESLREDPRLPDNHGLVVYQALVHVPIAVHVPGVPARVDPAPVSLVDLAPTVLALLGAPAAMSPLDGVELVPELLAAPAELRRRDRALVMNEQDQWAVVVWPLKLLVRPKDDLTELYDLSADPTEKRDLSGARPDDVKALRARYGEFPAVPMDRTQKGRRWREARAQPPPTPR
ncbi:MAG: sulfatase, partial [Deltaproteobacteria bacterium]|nr:sulfatase [Kofleriaceae bacterium]